MKKQLHQNPLSNLELAEFFHQISMLLHSGISVPEALHLLLADARNEGERQILTSMAEEAEMAGLLYPAAKKTAAFPEYAVHMIQLGEETGTLDEILSSLSDHYTREENFRQMLRSALVYPGIMLVMMAMIILVLLTKVMPIFQQVFSQLGQEMEGFSAGLLTIGQLLSRYSIGFTIGAAALILLFACTWKRLPFYVKLQDKLSACRFAGGMAVALKSGMTPEQGLDLASQLVDSSLYLSKIDNCRSLLSQGMDFSEALNKASIFSGSHSRIISVAGRTGQMDDAMSQIASSYEQETQNKITGWISMLEPTLVILLSLIVGIILLSVMLPLLGIMSGL